MSDPDKMAVIDRSEDGTVLLRGAGLGTVLGQFTWAAFDARGVVIPPSKLPTARKAIEAAGYHLHDPDARPAGPTAQRRMPLPLPECSNCHAPYRRTFRVDADTRCTECGHILRLEQHDPNVMVSGPESACPVCGMSVRAGWKFCTRGHALGGQWSLPDPEEERAPWRERYAEMVDPGDRAAAVAAFTDGFGVMPDDPE